MGAVKKNYIAGFPVTIIIFKKLYKYYKPSTNPTIQHSLMI